MKIGLYKIRSLFKDGIQAREFRYICNRELYFVQSTVYSSEWSSHKDTYRRGYTVTLSGNTAFIRENRIHNDASNHSRVVTFLVPLDEYC